MSHTGSDWGGRKAQEWTRAVLAAHAGPGGEPAQCWLRFPGVCTGVATTGDHLIQRRDRPDLAYVVENGRPACRQCNTKRKGAPLSRLAQMGGPVVGIIDASAFFDGTD